MKLFRLIILSLFFGAAIMSCNGLDGDNSDYDFGHKNSETPDNPYKDGYGRLPNSIRLATYNTHRCEGNIEQNASVDRSNYYKTAEVIKLMDPDVIALQELDSISTWHKAFQLKELADRTGMEYTYGYTITSRGGKYGNGILSKEKPQKVANIDLVGEEHRKMLVAQFQDYTFIATHFCHKNDENRKASVEIINNHIQTNFSNYGKPIYLAGDLNESNMNAEMFKLLLSKWEVISINRNTFIGGTPSRIDFILVYKGNNPVYKVLGSAVPTFNSIDVNTVSDHLPVLVDIEK